MGANRLRIQHARPSPGLKRTSLSHSEGPATLVTQGQVWWLTARLHGSHWRSRHHSLRGKGDSVQE